MTFRKRMRRPKKPEMPVAQIRSPWRKSKAKFEIRSKSRITTPKPARSHRLGHWDFGNWGLFRISDSFPYLPSTPMPFASLPLASVALHHYLVLGAILLVCGITTIDVERAKNLKG
jgi:hypothetical protein